MNYLITIAVQFFRWALAWVARELVLLIVTALVTNFFEEFRQLLLTFMDFIKDKIKIVLNKITGLSNQLEKSVKNISKTLERFFNKVENFNTFLVEKLEEIKKLLSKVLNKKTQYIQEILDNRVLSRLDEVKSDIKKLPIEGKEKRDILRKLTFAEKGVNKALSTTNDLNKSINTLIDKRFSQINGKIPSLPYVDTNELKNSVERLNKLIKESNQIINDEIDFIFSQFNEEQVRKILETQILKANDDIFENASEIVSSKVKKEIKTPKAKKIKWLNLKHREKANIEHATKFKINDIYRILVENFDRDERIALALRFAKKDHFRIGK